MVEVLEVWLMEGPGEGRGNNGMFFADRMLYRESCVLAILKYV